jgi:hypothetical protein
VKGKGEVEPLPPTKAAPKSAPDEINLDSPHRWQDSLLWKLRWLHVLQFQSPGLLIFSFSVNNSQTNIQI